MKHYIIIIIGIYGAPSHESPGRLQRQIGIFITFQNAHTHTQTLTHTHTHTHTRARARHNHMHTSDGFDANRRKITANQ